MEATNMKRKLGMLLVFVLLVTAIFAVAMGTASAADSVSISASATSVTSGTPFKLTVDAPGATEVRLQRLNSDTTWKNSIHSLGEYAVFQQQWNETQTFRARACIDGSWENYSDSVTVEVTYLGTLETPVYSAPTTVASGQDYVITWEDVDLAEWYYFDVFYTNSKGERQNVYYNDVPAGTETITIPTLGFEPGAYTVVAYPDCLGYARNNYEWPFTVTEAEYATGEVTLTVNATEILSGNQSRVTVSAPGASAIRLYRVYDNGETGVYREENGSSLDASWWVSNTRTYCATACFDGKWTDATDPVTVTVTYLGELEAPEYSAPETVEAGGQYTITWTDIGNAEWYEFELFNGQDDYLGYWSVESGVQTLSIPVNYVRGTYIMRAYPYLESYDNSNAFVEWTFKVTGQLPDAPEITADKMSALRGEEVNFTVSAPGAEKFLVQREYYADYDEYNAVDGKASFICDFWEKEGVRAAAFVDGKWSEWTDWMYIDVHSLGRLETPVVEDVNVTAGQPFTLKWSAVENTDEYTVNIEDTEGNVLVWEWAEGDQTSREINLPFEAGTYVAAIIAQSYEAYDSSYSGYGTITVTGELAAAPEATLQESEVYVSSSAHVVLDTEGAQYYAIDRTWNNGNSDRYSDEVYTVPQTISLYGSEEGYMDVRFSVFKNGAWTAWTEPMRVTFTSRGTLAKPVVTMPGVITAGQDLTISWEPVENAESYYIDVYDSAWDHIRGESFEPENDDLTWTLSLPLEAGTYRVEVSAQGEGYIRGETTVNFTVTGELADAPTATASTTQTAPGENVDFTVTADGLTRVLARYRYNNDEWYNTRYFETGSTGKAEPWMSFYEEGVVYVSFSAYCNGAWTAYSEPIAITLAYKGTLGTVPVTTDKTSYVAGSEVTVNWAEIENAESYRVVLYKDGNWDTSWSLQNPAEMSLTTSFPIEAGSYYFGINAEADGYEGSWSYSPEFTVTGTMAEGPVVSVNKASIEQYDNVTACVNMPDVEMARIKLEYPSGGYSSTMVSPDSNGDIIWIVSLRELGTHYFSMCVKNDGVWTDYGARTPVEVTEMVLPDGPVVTVPADAKAGEAITVTFTQMEGATRYYVYVYTLDGKWVANKYVSDAAATSATFEAGAIPAGTYEFYAEGYLSNYGYIEGEHVQATIGEPDADKAFKYYTNSDGENTITINGYLGSAPTEIIIPEKIGDYTVSRISYFDPADVSGLKRITIPASVTSISTYGFEDCPSDMTIVGYTGSAAEEFALVNGYTFERLDDGTTAVSATWDASAILINGEATYKLTAANVSDVRVYVDGRRNYNAAYALTYAEDNTTTIGAEVTLKLTEPGENIVRFSVYVDGTWINSPCYSITPISYGKMPAPANVAISSEAPVTGEIITFTWDAVENATQYGANLVHEEDDYEDYYLGTVSETSYDTYASQTFTAGTYHFYVQTKPIAGYEPSDRVKMIIQVNPKGELDYYGGYYNAIIGYYGTDKHVIIPAEIDGVKIESIYSSAFEDNTSIESVVISEGVTSIEYYAFNGCESLKKVVLPSTMTYIGGYVFVDTALESIVIPESVSSIGNYAFGYSSNITIYGYTGSYAETYASDNSLTFIALDDVEVAGPVFTLGSTTAYQNGKLTLNVIAPDAQKIRVYLDGELYGTEFAVTTGTATCEIDVGETLGERNVAIAQYANGVWSDVTQTQTFTVMATPTVTLTASTTAPQHGTYVTFTISAPGASKVRLERASVSSSTGWSKMYETEGDSVTVEFQWSMKRDVRAVGVYEDGEYVSEIITIDVTYLGTLAAPVCTAPATVKQGEDYIITWTDVENAVYYVFDVVNETGCVLSQEVSAGVETCTFETADLEPGEYAIIARSSALGWESSVSEWMITVEEPSALALKPAAHLMILGEKRLIEVEYAGEGTPALTWKSSDETVATVANGVVTAKGFGEAEITVTATLENGTVAEAICAITVINPGTYKLPASLTKIEDEAFDVGGAQCVVIPASVTSVGSKAFANNDELILVIIEGKNTVIASDAFVNATNVQAVCHKGSNVHLSLETMGIPCVFIGE